MSDMIQAKIEKMIYFIRNEKVMLDSDLAQLYEVSTKRLNEQVTRNRDHFPSDFVFKLTQKEYEFLRSQFATFKKSTARRKYRPYVFTEQGIAMLSSVLKSTRAIQVNISIMRTFVKLRKLLASDESVAEKMIRLEKGSLELKKNTNKLFQAVFERLDDVDKSLEVLKSEIPTLPVRRRKIGFSKKD